MRQQHTPYLITQMNAAATSFVTLLLELVKLEPFNSTYFALFQKHMALAPHMIGASSMADRNHLVECLGEAIEELVMRADERYEERQHARQKQLATPEERATQQAALAMIDSEISSLLALRDRLDQMLHHHIQVDRREAHEVARAGE